jgi:hypothetical protein
VGCNAKKTNKIRPQWVVTLRKQTKYNHIGLYRQENKQTNKIQPQWVVTLRKETKYNQSGL